MASLRRFYKCARVISAGFDWSFFPDFISPSKQKLCLKRFEVHSCIFKFVSLSLEYECFCYFRAVITVFHNIEILNLLTFFLRDFPLIFVQSWIRAFLNFQTHSIKWLKFTQESLRGKLPFSAACCSHLTKLLTYLMQEQPTCYENNRTDWNYHVFKFSIKYFVRES